MASPRVSVVVVNYRTPELAVVAVDSALASGAVQPSVIIVENEGDGAWTRERYGEDARVRVIANAGNPGFGAACNQGIELAMAGDAEFVCLLNSDARLEPGALARLAPLAARRGIACPRILRPDGSLYSTGGLIELNLARCRNRDYGMPDHGQNNVPVQVDFGSGCVLMLSRAALETGIRFHEPYFLYYEDADLCLALAAHGFTVGYVPEARALHQDGGSMRSSPTLYYNTRNRLVFLRRWGSPLEIVFGSVYLCLVLTVKTGAEFLRGRKKTARSLWLGLRDGWQGRMGPWRAPHD